MADVEEEVPVEETPVEEEGAVDEPIDNLDEEDDVPVSSRNEIKLFGKWSFDGIEVRDLSLVVSIHGTTIFIKRKNAVVHSPPFLLFFTTLGLHCLQG